MRQRLASHDTVMSVQTSHRLFKHNAKQRDLFFRYAASSKYFLLHGGPDVVDGYTKLASLMAQSPATTETTALQCQYANQRRKCPLPAHGAWNEIVNQSTPFVHKEIGVSVR